MKSIQQLGTILLFVLTLVACEFDVSINTGDDNTLPYATLKENGLKFDYVYQEINGFTESRNTYSNGERIHFFFNNPQGFKIENGHVFPGVGLYLIKNDQDTVFKQPDLLANLVRGTDISPLILTSNFTPVFDSKSGDTYKVWITIWDKKGDATFDLEMPFTMVENNYLDISSQNIDYSRIYLWNQSEKTIISQQQVHIEDSLILIIEGLDGLNVIDGLVHPSLSLYVEDDKGNRIISDDNIFKNYTEQGISYGYISQRQLPVFLTFDPNSGDIHNPYKLNVLIKDTKSNHKLEIKSEIEFHKSNIDAPNP